VLCFSVSIWLTMENSKAAGFKTLNHSKMLPIWQIAHLSHYHRKKKKTVQKNVLFAFWHTLETNTITL